MYEQLKKVYKRNSLCLRLLKAQWGYNIPHNVCSLKETKLRPIWGKVSSCRHGKNDPTSPWNMFHCNWRMKCFVSWDISYHEVKRGTFHTYVCTCLYVENSRFGWRFSMTLIRGETPRFEGETLQGWNVSRWRIAISQRCMQWKLPPWYILVLLEDAHTLATTARADMESRVFQLCLLAWGLTTCIYVVHASYFIHVSLLEPMCTHQLYLSQSRIAYASKQLKEVVSVLFICFSTEIGNLFHSRQVIQ